MISSSSSEEDFHVFDEYDSGDEDMGPSQPRGNLSGRSVSDISDGGSEPGELEELGVMITCGVVGGIVIGSLLYLIASVALPILAGLSIISVSALTAVIVGIAFGVVGMIAIEILVGEDS